MPFAATPSFKILAIALLGAVSACTVGGGAPKPNTNGDDALTCGALLFAVHDFKEGRGNKADVELINDSYLSASTRYATVHAETNGKTAQEALSAIKVKGYRMSGTISSGNDRLPTDEIVKRAKACVEAV